MLTFLAYSLIAVFMALIMSNRLSALIALITVPVVFAALAGFGPQIPEMAMSGIKSIAPTAVLLLFAILYFGLMIDVGLFDPLVRLVVRLCHGDPLRVIVGTTLLSMVISLDGDGSTTYLLVVSAMMPLHRRLGINPFILPAVTVLPNAVINIAPWGGPTARVMASLKVDVSQVFVPLLPAIAITCFAAVLIAVYFGLQERRRLGIIKLADDGGEEARAAADAAMRAVVPRSAFLQAFNGLLTIAIIALLIMDVLPLGLVFMIGFAIAMTVNFPLIADQRARIEAHAGSVLMVVSVVFGAGVFTGILSGTGMTKALAESVVSLIPASAGSYIPVITAAISAPFTFFLSNDAFYFGVVPVIAHAAEAYGIPPEVIARASLIGQPVHMLSPLVPAAYVLTGLSKVEFGAHQRFSLKWAGLLVCVMLVSAILTGAVPSGL
ncbi:CitMHS family transporter [Rhizobium paknamense]|uniref:CitMHS family citrate-Mg2+:H+ or citrate-Ca2+:H+ symporter n=1 Tax=Rhizobium paknamense TaxID=1206817 RepID=A0ABU0I7X9_9HYPH|nr:citrate:proton symporter [Rhizobium paknamense]MDQ0454336.1 CitMHS family citrate-Mg2+:H+ or citrate-Ca2+:H+ symporter [Rhizobium paknamense]